MSHYNSYSLNKLDVVLEQYLKDIDNGFYIECGANDGISQSNTLFYKNKYNWKGLLVEPNLHKFNECVTNRPNDIVENYALVSDSYDKDTIRGYFQFNDYENSLCGHCDFMSTERFSNVDPIDVPAITLAKLITKHNINKIDFLSLDVENYEINVLEGLNLNYNKPKYILVETANVKEKQDNMFNFLSSKKYIFVKRFGNDDFYEYNS